MNYSSSLARWIVTIDAAILTVALHGVRVAVELAYSATRVPVVT